MLCSTKAKPPVPVMRVRPGLWLSSADRGAGQSYELIMMSVGMSRVCHDLHEHLWDAWWHGLVGEEHLLS